MAPPGAPTSQATTYCITIKPRNSLVTRIFEYMSIYFFRILKVVRKSCTLKQYFFCKEISKHSTVGSGLTSNQLKQMHVLRCI